MGAINMVYIKALKNEILDTQEILIQSPLYVIGAAAAALTTQVVLFEREDVIVNRIEKLPVLKGLAVSFGINPAIYDGMLASALETVSLTIRIYNGPLARNDLIKAKNIFVSVQTAGAGAVSIFVEPLDDLEITVLMASEMNIVVDLGSDDVVAGANLPAGYINARVIAEFDWVKISADELKDYAVEQLYTQ